MGKPNQKGFAVIEAILAIVLIIGLVVIGYAVWKTDKDSTNADKTTKTVASQHSQTTQKPTTSASKLTTYTSETEKSSFQYPTSWKVVEQAPQTSDQYGVSGDQIAIKSPSGKLQLIWESLVGGVGGDCLHDIAPSQGGCTAFTYTSATPLATEGSLVVASGWAEVAEFSASGKSSGSTFIPILAIRNASDVKIGMEQRDIGYQFFQARNAGKSASSPDPGVSFFTINGVQMGASNSTTPHFSSAQAAKAYLNDPEFVAAKQILLSYHY